MKNKNSISLPKLLETLWQEGFFSEPNDRSEILDEFAKRGYRFQSSNLGVVLIRAVRRGFLSRFQESGRWKYVQKYPIESPSGQRIVLFERYDFHPKVKEVAFKQFEDGYFKEAIQNALVEVINQVKIKTGHPKDNNRDLDGDDLMNKTFGCDGGGVPKIKFNSLADGLDRAEQRGLMFLFKGVVGIRDRKAHLNFIQNDPLKTIEYLSLASLLMRLLDESAGGKRGKH